MDLLVFKSTKSRHHGGHVTGTICRPDYIAAFERHWGDNITLWPCIRLVGEEASEGKSREDQERQAISYVHYLLLARPDLYVAQGLLTDDDTVMFLFGIGGVGIQTFSVKWGSKDLHKFVYAFIYRLYDPGDFADPSYVEMVPNVQAKSVTFNVQITPDVVIPNLRPVYASNPFETRTHILSSDSPVPINGKPFSVLKDQLCRVGTRFHEHSILTHVHHPEKVPGVVEAVHHEVITIPRNFCMFREKHRIGLRQKGKPLTSIPTVEQILEVIFDLLEGDPSPIIHILYAHTFAVLRYLRFERQTLHRDIHKGNVLYIEDDLPSSTGARSSGAGTNEIAGPEALPLCFIKYLLGERCVAMLHNWAYTNVTLNQ
jgi:hypothetical protein